MNTGDRVMQNSKRGCYIRPIRPSMIAFRLIVGDIVGTGHAFYKRPLMSYVWSRRLFLLNEAIYRLIPRIHSREIQL
jgi:hypothetical protein